MQSNEPTGLDHAKLRALLMIKEKSRNQTLNKPNMEEHVMMKETLWSIQTKREEDTLNYIKIKT